MEKIEKSLFWSMLMGFAVMVLWMVMIIFLGDWIYAFHSRLWQMDQYFPKELFYSANLIGVGMWKMAVMLFFAIPWLALKIIEK